MDIYEGRVFHIKDDPEAAIQVAAVFEDGSILISYPGRPAQGATLVKMSYWPELCERLAITAASQPMAAEQAAAGASPAPSRA